MAGCTPNPSAPWVIQQARHLSWTLTERATPIRFLIRDRDQKFTGAFDEVFRAEKIEVVRTPFRAPQANGVAERFVRTARSECFDRLLILNQDVEHQDVEHLARVIDGPPQPAALSIDHQTEFIEVPDVGARPPAAP